MSAHRFQKAYIEITGSCNLACTFCIPSPRQTVFLKSQDFSRILEQLKGLTPLVYFHVLGEPLLHPRWAEYLAEAGAQGFKVGITTNGSLLESCTESLLTSPHLHRINLSLHSIQTEKHYQTVLDFIQVVLAHRNDPESKLPFFPVSLRLWNLGSSTPSEGSEVQADSEFWLNRLLQDLNLSKVNSALSQRLTRGLTLHRAPAFVWPKLDGPWVGEHGFCMGLRDQVGILANGTVVPCCLDGSGDLALGQLKGTATLEEILAGSRAQSLYHGFSRRQVTQELCRRCSYRLRFDS